MQAAGGHMQKTFRKCADNGKEGGREQVAENVWNGGTALWYHGSPADPLLSSSREAAIFQLEAALA